MNLITTVSIVFLAVLVSLMGVSSKKLKPNCTYDRLEAAFNDCKTNTLKQARFSSFNDVSDKVGHVKVLTPVS